MRPTFALLALALAPACIIVVHKGVEGEPPVAVDDTGWIDDTGTACTDIAFASVMVHVVDAAGAPLSGANVTYSVDGAPELPAECADDAGCANFVAGWEVAGDFTITASIDVPTEDPYCWYYDTEVSTVTVPSTEDGCHVITQDVTVTLDPVDMVCE